MEAAEQRPHTRVNYLRHHERVALEDEKAALERQLSHPQIQDPANVKREIQKRDWQLRQASPPPLTPEERDAVAKRERDLRNELTSNMLSAEEMRKRPDGAVGRLMAFEKRFKSKILEWKNLRIALDPDNDDPDHANLERFRPMFRPGDRSMSSAFIPGQEWSFPSEQFKANYDAIDFSAHGGMTPEERADLERQIEEERTARKILQARLDEIDERLAAAAPAKAAAPKKKATSRAKTAARVLSDGDS